MKSLAEGELAGCPFCGKPGAIDEEPSKAIPDRTVFIPSCSDSDCIGVLINSFARRAEAIAAWNHRAHGTFADGVEAAGRLIEAKFDYCCYQETLFDGADMDCSYWTRRRKQTGKLLAAIRAISAPPAQGEG